MNRRNSFIIVLIVAISFLFTPQANAECDVTISGNIYYRGAETGQIFVAMGSEGDSSFAALGNIPAPGPYSLHFTNEASSPKLYRVLAQMDVNGIGTVSPESFQQNEPTGIYESFCGGQNQFEVGCGTIENVDIYLSDFKQIAIFHDSFDANFFTGDAQDMAYHDGLWICNETGTDNGPIDIYRVDPSNGQLLEAHDLNVDHVTSMEWVGNDMWICFKGDTSWVIRKYAYNGSTFTPGVSYPLPSSMDSESIWSINIAWDGDLLWIQEKGPCGNIYKMNLNNGAIVETIADDDFGLAYHLGTADISDMCFADGYLWAMNDDRPKFARYDPFEFMHSIDVNYTFEYTASSNWEHQYAFEENNTEYKYNGMVKHGDLIYFLQIANPYTPGAQNKILVASLDQTPMETINLAALANGYGTIDAQPGPGVVGDGDGDGDIDGLDLAKLVCCLE